MKVICCVCGVEFSATPFQVKRGRKYCSHACNARVNFGKVKQEPRFEQVDKPLLDGWTLGKIRAFYKRGLKCVVKDSCGVPMGEYDIDGNLKEY